MCSLKLYWGHPLFNDAWLDLHVWSTLVFVEASDHKAIDEELSCTLALCAELQYARFHLFNVGNYTLNIPSVWIVHNTQFNLGNMGDVWLLDLKCGWNCLLYTVLENSIQTKWCRSSYMLVNETFCPLWSNIYSTVTHQKSPAIRLCILLYQWIITNSGT